MTAKRIGIVIFGLGMAAAPLGGAGKAAAPPAQAGGAGDFHVAPSPEIIVTAPYRRERADVLSGVAVLQGVQLQQALRPTIGETLARTPGVSSTAFGPNASRPVLRGLQGERVRVLTDGIGAIDVSNTSVDHAVVIDPLLAERIEVLRGPEALLYGSAAIGGVVNVLDRRIPRSVPDEPIHIDAITSYGSAARERTIGGAVDVPVSSTFVVHADGSYLKTSDLRIGGPVLDRNARSRALATALLPPDPAAGPIDYAASANLRGILPNSAAETWTAGVGAALVTSGGSLGLSYSHYDSLYGVPVRYATLPGETQEAPRLDLKQDRFDARAEVKTGGAILEAVRARLAYATYRHFELEEDGAVGTAFYNKGMEGRVELVQAPHGGWRGATGAQFFSRDFDVVGEEAFLPPNSTEQVGLFTLQQVDIGRVKLEAGGRYEFSRLSSDPRAGQPQFAAIERTFGTVSGSAGVSYRLGGAWRIGANLSHTVRAPSAEELFANGPHGGTEAYELGSPDFRRERSTGLEAILRGAGTGYSFELSAYHNRFSNFIYQARADQSVCEARAIDADGDGVGDVELPCFQFAQASARYYGFEVQGTLTVAQIGAAKIAIDGLADYVHASIRDFRPAPRIPPLRVLAGIAATSPRFDARLEVERTMRQNRISPLETETAGFTLVNAEFAFRPWAAARAVSLTLAANNIFDFDARRHASFLKDFAPLAGRDIRVGARVSF